MPKQSEPERFRRLMSEAGRDRTASRVIVSLLRADSKASQALERALAAAELSLPQFNVLMVLAASTDGRLPIYELNEHLVSTPPNTSWLSDRMRERGLVRKSRSPHDGRVVLLEMTEKGWSALRKAAPSVFDNERELLKNFSRSELKTLGDLLSRFLE